MTSSFVPTTTNMVMNVRNIIEGYRDGTLRALAQEPVQNSVDAAPKGRAHVEYRLHKRGSSRGGEFFILTVTDSNTSGLRGPIRSFNEAVAGGPLGEGQNWAAFEGMGYTKKSSEEPLGSRGQGKAAYLYHSNPPILSAGQERMLMLYDTLLPSGEYRLGVRYANPADVVLNPPLLEDEARNTVRNRYVGDDLDVELGLEPLTEVGTRIIVPYLSEEAAQAIRSGELAQWLQRSWWRAVQIGLSISVVQDDGSTQTVSVPRRWEGEHWKKGSGNLRSWENIEVGDGLKIKRVVLSYDEAINDDRASSDTGLAWGVQLLRGRQWIETLGQEHLGDYVPRDKRAGFHGFVEFDREAERALRRAESPQHDRFDRRHEGVKELVDAVVSRVREFAEAQGWNAPAPTRPAPDRERDAAWEFLRFLAPRARAGGSNPGSGQADLQRADRWECSLRLDYPNPRTIRVDWGERIRNVTAVIKLEPSSGVRPVAVSLGVLRVGDASSRTTCGSQTVDVRNGEAIVNFGDFQVIRDAPSTNQLQCSQAGQWQFVARVVSAGNEVATARRSFFVNEDPPPRSAKPYTLSISVENHTTGQRRINSGETVGVQISVSNNTPDDETFELNAALGGLLLADSKPVPTRGVPAGAPPNRVAGLQEPLVVNPGAGSSPLLSVSLPPGRHSLRADLFLSGGVVAHASRTLDIEIDPAQAQDWPPFRVEQISGGPHPRWQFNKDDPSDWVLRYPPEYLIYRALGSGPARSGQRLSGAQAFVVEVCAEGIIEWAMEPVTWGDVSRLEELLSGVPSGANQDLWEKYDEKMRQLSASYSSASHSNANSPPGRPEEYSQLARECAALALSLFEERT